MRQCNISIFRITKRFFQTSVTREYLKQKQSQASFAKKIHTSNKHPP